MLETGATIAALSSGRPPSGIAVVRVSGEGARAVVRAVAGAGEVPVRRPVLRTLRDPSSGETIDRGLVLLFDGPGTATGEDVAEFHVHGGPAVVTALLEALFALPDVRPAEPGEFTRRAFLNGRMDLTEVEGLSDLVAAETAMQRRQALRIAGGVLRAAAEEWRRRLVAARARVEAELDFADEGDVGAAPIDPVREDTIRLLAEIREALERSRSGERIREGFRVAVVGPPNAGKSSLVNALSRRDVAIVTDVPGTTRDAIEVRLDLSGWPVSVVDTAGLRATDDPVERIGVERARVAAREADLVLELVDATAPNWTSGEQAPSVGAEAARRLRVVNKIDLVPKGGPSPRGDLEISVRTGLGLAQLEARLAMLAAQGATDGEPALVTRSRQRRHLEAAAASLARAVDAMAELPLEIAAEELRSAGEQLGRLVGRIDVEDVLDDIFASFCIGK